jgi:hypothetical protein
VSHPPADCRITLRGSFDLNWADYVGAMLVDVLVEEGHVRTTALIGHPIDLAAFLGTLHMLIDRGFPVVAFEYRETDEAKAVARPSSTYAQI